MSLRVTFIFLMLLSFFYNSKVNAQCSAYFDVSHTRIIVGDTVTIDGTGLSSCANPFYYYTATGPITSADNPSIINNFTYTAPGIYKIVVTSTVCTATGCSIGNWTSQANIEVLDTIKPKFSVSNCKDINTKISISENRYDFYRINWGDGSSIETVSGNNFKTHNYADTISRNVTVTGIYQYTVGGSSLGKEYSKSSISRAIPINNLIEPYIQQLNLSRIDNDSGYVTLKFIADSRMKYQLSQRAGIIGSYSVIDTLKGLPSGTITFTISGLNTVSNQYCFKLEAVDDCGNAAGNVDICTVSLTGFSDNTGNHLKWNFANGIIASGSNYNISVNGQTLASFLPDNVDKSYNDLNVKCRQIYCYVVEANCNCASIDPVKSISAPVCLEGQVPTNFSKVANFNSTFENDKLNLFWTPATFTGAVYNVKEENSSQSDSTLKSKIVPSKQNGNCYLIQLKDKCGTSPVSRTCPVKLTGQVSSFTTNSTQWTDYINGDSIPIGQYIIERYTNEGVFIEELPQGNSTAFIHNPIDTTNQIVKYRVKTVLSDSASTIVYSNFVSIKQELRVFVPSAFTPNGDGLNEVFAPKGLFWEEYELKIYNRWGQTVFSSTDKTQGWDGGSFGPGLYNYYIRVKSKYGDVKPEIGYLNLLR